jgi:hypothetical protein
MAFGTGQDGRASRIRRGDKLFLYTSRAAFNNPTRDESQLLGLATARTAVARLSRPVVIADRQFVVGCKLHLQVVLPLRRALPFRPLVDRLSFVARKDAWSAYMRSSLIRLPTGDAHVLERALIAASTQCHA